LAGTQEVVDELSRNAQQLSDLVRAVGETLDGFLRVIRRSDDEFST
jgi:hypothetical protein